MTKFIKSDGKETDICDFIENEIDGNDYSRGRLEAVCATADNAAKVISRVVVVLRNRGLITDSEIESLVDDIF